METNLINDTDMFKEGDILRFYNDARGESCVFILANVHNDDWIEAHAKYSFAFKELGIGKDKTETNIKYSTGCLRDANEWEKNFLLNVMENNGYSYDFRKNKIRKFK